MFFSMISSSLSPFTPHFYKNIELITIKFMYICTNIVFNHKQE